MWVMMGLEVQVGKATWNGEVECRRGQGRKGGEWYPRKCHSMRRHR